MLLSSSYVPGYEDLICQYGTAAADMTTTHLYVAAPWILVSYDSAFSPLIVPYEEQRLLDANFRGMERYRNAGETLAGLTA